MSSCLVDAWGWESVFYIEGGACFAWVVLWILLAADTPATHPTIRQTEVEYIEAGLPDTHSGSLPIPWRQIWTSVPFWAIVLSNTAFSWVFDLLMTELPQVILVLYI